MAAAQVQALLTRNAAALAEQIAGEADYDELMALWDVLRTHERQIAKLADAAGLRLEQMQRRSRTQRVTE